MAVGARKSIVKTLTGRVVGMKSRNFDSTQPFRAVWTNINDAVTRVK